MERIDSYAKYSECVKLDWLIYKNDNNKYCLKSARKTSTNTFNFSLSEELESVYCLCLNDMKLHIFKVSGIHANINKITFNENLELNNEGLELNPIDIITIDKLDYWTNYQDEQSRIESLATKKRLEGNDGKFETKEKFINWYNKEKRICCYCGVEEKDLKEYFNKDNEQYKDARQRGQVLEIERIVTAPKEKNVYSPENCSLSCYICNNAKSDFISPKDFKPIAYGINKFWKNYLNKDVNFPEKSKIWEMK
ncbi:hypothetical protein GCM10012288_25090 [Malaciobacter pacificus]|uniref:Uncharacterized protein n=1 Tax=Malaciobacter pacificus TaxID=1080223 RepID=A0A5C2HE97_9BACT|nr:hypothetical protein [Malaciobacter pacificus]QEP34692.1 hypothetical protein APAC_1594 [Malaciobacter pacificus]GGD50046.1 hypothetical protein GCM10012288_25090 [Malaciobacter pacificus]